MARLIQAEEQHMRRKLRCESIARRSTHLLIGSGVTFIGSVAGIIAESQNTTSSEPLYDITLGGFLISALTVSASGIARAIASDKAKSHQDSADEALVREFNKIMSGDELSLFRHDFGDPPESSE